ncbi:NAD-dependent epimerase/dehydratase family protein [Enterococcus asini]|uniref:NAD-dependent epimerase/dehydratase family protein n=1 Tax=Enterococcus asini TaxID=57732 RepID=A0AAW8TYD9_9ENTE|nr:NAD-dependent epimerase/dehydratase family protein [Enterococcus asini]MDT2811263.1 NAD-dependent epimerase/dehydratase family protein [Enterococcus asini]
MKYLVTGGAGFIGSNLTNMLVKKGHEVVVIDDLSMGKVENLNDLGKVEFIKGSITNKELMKSILTKYQFDYVFHLAAVASVADSVERPVETHEVNYNAVLNILDLIRKHQRNLKRFVFASSAAVYGDDPELPKKETSSIKPMTQYAVDKFAAERTAINFNNLYNVPASAVRFFNVYGPNQNPESPYSGVISILLDRYTRNLKGENIVFTLFGDGSQVRDFIFIEDVLHALLLVSESEISLGQVFNVGTENETDLNQVIMELNEIYGFDLPITYEAARVGDIHRSVADISSLKSLGFMPENTVFQGLSKLVEFLGR